MELPVQGKQGENYRSYRKISKFYKICNFIFNMFCKLIVFFYYYLCLDFSIITVIMYGIFSVTTDVIIVLYESIDADNMDLFKALV